MSMTGVHWNGGGLASKTTQTWPVLSWQNAASRLVKAALDQTRTPSCMAKVVVMLLTFGLVQKG